MPAQEINFDSIIGPTHHYAGLARGNLASQSNARQISNPRAAALQGLAKMKRVMDLGVPQAVLPPHLRPDITALRRMGFFGTDNAILAAAHKHDPTLLSACSSASAMWAANAATICPSADAADGRVHITPANLGSHLHRSLETPMTAAILKAIFHDDRHFTHHAPLPASMDTSDEGAANHTGLCVQYQDRGLHIFTYGRDAGEHAADTRYIPRQTRQASEAIARLHGVESHSIFLRQHPEAIAAGVFHNDVIAVGNQNVFLCHEKSYADPGAADQIAESFQRHCGQVLQLCVIPETLLPLHAAVKSYLFNSQLLSVGGGMLLLAPDDCREMPEALQAIDMIRSDCPAIQRVEFVDVRQSMRNGGGPACLRLRVVLTENELKACHSGVLLTPSLCTQLEECVRRHYRDTLSVDDLADPHLWRESHDALSEMAGILGLLNIYQL